MLAHTILLVFGLYFMACGAGLLANPDRMARLIDELEDSPAIGFLCGAVMIICADLALLRSRLAWLCLPSVRSSPLRHHT